DNDCNGVADNGLTCACNPSVEICDGVDNDCNGLIDDGFAGLGTLCEVGIGACYRAGYNECSTDKLSVVCSVTAGSPSTEVCNGIDDNCDGDIDESLSCPSAVLEVDCAPTDPGCAITIYYGNGQTGTGTGPATFTLDAERCSWGVDINARRVSDSAWYSAIGWLEDLATEVNNNSLTYDICADSDQTCTGVVTDAYGTNLHVGPADLLCP
ncbi:MAG: MopE-related protein, partial [Patescibacteria group bacterium]|nr:MopE-related protein [Patescibacteria group bacterium]